MAGNGDGLFQRGEFWSFRYRDSKNRWRERSTGKSKKAEARKEKQRFLDDLNNGKLPSEMAAWTLKQACDHWLTWRTATKPGRTPATERSFLRRVLTVFGENRILQTITPHDFEAYQAKRLRRPGTLTGVKSRTVNYELFCLRQILKRADLWPRFREHYRPLPVPKGGPGQALSDADAIRLFQMANLKSSWEAAFCAALLAHCTGMRAGEIRALQLGDIHADNNAPSIHIRAEATKSRRDRHVPLNATALWAMKRLLTRATRLGASRTDHYLLPADRSRHNRADDPRRGSRGYDPTAHQNSWKSAWKSLRKAAGIPGFRFHDLRHTFISAGAEADVPIGVVQSIVGHLSPQMTEHYTHIRSSAQQRAAETIGDANKHLFQNLMLDDKEGTKTIQ